MCKSNAMDLKKRKEGLISVDVKQKQKELLFLIREHFDAVAERTKDIDKGIGEDS